jgi:hypothetical protein
MSDTEADHATQPTPSSRDAAMAHPARQPHDHGEAGRPSRFDHNVATLDDVTDATTVPTPTTRRQLTHL